jgi:ribosomal protein S18 acetylase RimI-like enzyme
VNPVFEPRRDGSARRPLSDAYEVRQLSDRQLVTTYVEPALHVFARALGYLRQHPRVDGQGSSMRRHATRAGFLAFGAFDASDRMVGFSYGYTSAPGLWWREQVAAGLTVSQRDRWLTDAFEVAELHVEPAAQGQKLGSQLHDRLVFQLPHQTALLSVMHRSERAWRLYRSRGWQTLIEDLRFSTDPITPFSVLGLEIPR